jgi:MADS-box transcription enhancer factor 2
LALCKRKLALFKKAYELSCLCECEVGILIRSGNGRWYDYATGDMDELLLRFTKEYTDIVSMQRLTGSI